jgi:hypothetical protein
MSVLDSQASEDFAADWDAWHKQHEDLLLVAVEAGEQLPFEAKAKEARRHAG